MTDSVDPHEVLGQVLTSVCAIVAGAQTCPVGYSGPLLLWFISVVTFCGVHMGP